MKYDDYRAHIKSGDLLAWSHRSLKSWYDLKVWMVRILTASEYSHVGIAMVFGGRVWVIESVTPVIRIVPLSNLRPFYCTDVPGVQWAPAVDEFAFSLVGHGDYSQCEAMRAYFEKNDPDNDAWECAELAKILLERAGVKLDGRAIPSDLVLEVQRRGGRTVYIE